MTGRKKSVYIILAVTALAVIAGRFIFRSSESPADSIRYVNPAYGDIKIFISTTGEVLPQNRLEIKPAISGRVERILVNEGQDVKAGQVLLWMSSLERAALIDAARAKGGEAAEYWENAYKPIPVVAPITGKVIVRSVEPGQTVDTGTAILVISDRLIVRANVDETDIGRVTVGQGAVISLDAYRDVTVNGRVNHISYESQVVNNVTMYEVDIIPEKIPAVFRSGMSANIEIIEKGRTNILLLPSEAVKREGNDEYVLTGSKAGGFLKRTVKTGISDEKNIEIVSGIDKNDKVIIQSKGFSLPADRENGTNPFLPFRKDKKNK